MTVCRWCGGDTTQPGHDHTLRHQIWLFVAQVLWFS
jgi:hypothetical protein